MRSTAASPRTRRSPTASTSSRSSARAASTATRSTATLVWQKDFGQLRMYNNFGEGAWTALDGNKLVVVLDHEGESFLVALDKSTGRELWRTPRQGNTNWSGPYITTHNGRKQVIVSASREVVRLRSREPASSSGRRPASGRTRFPRRSPPTEWCFVMSGFRNPNLMAIRLGREGDLTGTDAIVWQNQRGNSYTRVAGAARRQAVRAHRHRHALRLRREDRQAVLPAGAASRSPTTSRRRPWARTASCISPPRTTTSSW